MSLRTEERLAARPFVSQAFFSTVPRTEDVLQANRCFKAFYAFCEAQDSLFFWDTEETTAQGLQG